MSDIFMVVRYHCIALQLVDCLGNNKNGQMRHRVHTRPARDARKKRNLPAQITAKTA